MSGEGKQDWKRELSHDQRTELVDRIVEMLKDGDLDWNMVWDAATLVPQNPITGSPYHGINRLWLAHVARTRGYDDPRWCTFAQAKRNGWMVRKGSKCAYAEKWKLVRFKDDVQADDDDGKADGARPVLQAMFQVFNFSCIEGAPVLVVPKLEDTGVLAIADGFIESSRCPIGESDQARSFYSVTEDRIELPERGFFNTELDFLATLLHEMGHSTGAKGRLDRDIANLFGTPDYAMEELRAELCAVLMEAEVGLQSFGSVFENHAAYLGGWLKAIGDDPRELYRVLADAEGMCDYLMDAYRTLTESRQKVTA